ncbi:MAG: PEGA domain-containing protein [Myxococcales bacterium]|nr:MAG: PEGA domain-containing protein [Myxococcales bacterium]
MSFPRTFHRALLLAALVVTPAVARAEDATSPSAADAKRAQGKARYERGVEAYSAGRYKDAIDLFLQADSLAPSAALSFNIARAYEKIGDDAAALQWYRDFRRREPKAKNAVEVDARISALESVLAQKGVQQVTISSRPAGATVIVDDKPVGVTPFTGQLTPGAHQVVLTLKGYADTERELVLRAERAQDLEVALEAQPASATPVGTSTSGAPAPSPSAPRKGPRFGPWPWVTLGAGGVVLGASLGFELARRSAEDAANGERTQVDYKDKLDTEQSRQTTARVLLVAGSALVVTGGVLLAIDLSSRRQPEKQAQLGALCLPGACAVQVRGAF